MFTSIRIMHTITATLVAYYHICHRKVWLHAHQIQMESGSEAVAEGKLIGETAYADRPGRYTEVALEGVKIDFYMRSKKRKKWSKPTSLN
jgi:CRISPR-associated exonuclease Cas4